MADILFNFFFLSILILVQSFFLNALGFYDILLVWIFYYYMVSEDKVRVFLLCIFAGYLKDSLSGGVFGVYLSSYLWFFLIIRVSSFYLNLNNHIFITLFGIAGVVINGFFLFVSNYEYFLGSVFFEEIFSLYLRELIYCFFSFLILFYLFNRVRELILMVKADIQSKLAKLSRI
ncbi:MAG: hypothetical protein H6680_00255 [Desulfobacteraceae bacterium]|nr:hypothetical protein [Desulfobacteraceae bacterium]